MGNIEKRRSNIRHEFACHSGQNRIKRLVQHSEDGDVGLSLTCIWLGLAARQFDKSNVEIGFACHDGTYTMDSAVNVLEEEGREGSKANAIETYMIARIGEYAYDNAYRFLGAGLPEELTKLCPDLATRLWSELDIVPIVLQKEDSFNDLDETADSMARKCVM